MVEQNSGSFPAGAIVTYVPADADDPGVTIAGGVGVVIGIVNDFSGVAVQRATIELTKTVVAVPDVEVPEAFTAHVECDDGTSTDVTLPGTGGPGTPVVTARAPALCLIEELAASVPPGWVVTYSVDGGPPSATAPLVGPIDGNATVAITITNDPTGATTTTSTTTTTTVAPTTTTAAGSTSSTTGASGGVVGAEDQGKGSDPGTGSGDLPFTGLNVGVALGAAVVSLAGGLMLLGEARRRKVQQSD